MKLEEIVKELKKYKKAINHRRTRKADLYDVGLHNGIEKCLAFCEQRTPKYETSKTFRKEEPW